MVNDRNLVRFYLPKAIKSSPNSKFASTSEASIFSTKHSEDSKVITRSATLSTKHSENSKVITRSAT